MHRLLHPLCLLALLAAPRVASAQELQAPKARQGYYVGGSIRSGLSSAVADADSVGGFGALTHFGAFVRFGQKTLPSLSVGLALGGGAESNDIWSVGYGGLLLELEAQPFPIDLAFRGGVGVGGGSVSRVDESLEQDDDPGFLFGPMYSLGVSYDWFPFYSAERYDSGGAGLSIFLEGRLFQGGDAITGGGFLGLEFTWWTGLPKRKLELPLDQAF